MERTRLLLFLSAPLFLFLNASFSSEDPSSLPEGIEYIRTEKDLDLPAASDSLMENSPYREAYRDLLEQAYGDEIPDMEDTASLKQHSEELVAVGLKVGGKKQYWTILPVPFVRSEKEVQIIRCQCLDECEHDSCLVMLGGGGGSSAVRSKDAGDRP